MELAGTIEYRDMIVDYNYKADRRRIGGLIVIKQIMKVDEFMNRVDMKWEELVREDYLAIINKCEVEVLNIIKGDK